MEQGALKSVEDSDELREILLGLIHKSDQAQEWKTKALAAQNILQSQRGASKRLAKLVQTLHG